VDALVEELIDHPEYLDALIKDDQAIRFFSVKEFRSLRLSMSSH
jgi:hypothetical protein